MAQEGLRLGEEQRQQFSLQSWTPRLSTWESPIQVLRNLCVTQKMQRWQDVCSKGCIQWTWLAPTRKKPCMHSSGAITGFVRSQNTSKTSTIWERPSNANKLFACFFCIHYLFSPFISMPSISCFQYLFENNVYLVY